MHFQRLLVDNKAEFKKVIESIQPDILIAIETSLSSDISDGELGVYNDFIKYIGKAEMMVMAVYLLRLRRTSSTSKNHI